MLVMGWFNRRTDGRTWRQMWSSSAPAGAGQPDRRLAAEQWTIPNL